MEEHTARTGTYELMVILPATFSDAEAADLKAKVNTTLAEHGATVREEEDLGKRKLAFPIQHIRQGFYHLYKFEGPRSSIKKLDETFRLMPEVLRHLITVWNVRTEAQLEAQAALRERIQAKRIAAEERAVADRRAQEALQAEKVTPQQPTREVSKEELEKKLEEILTDENLGA